MQNISIYLIFLQFVGIVFIIYMDVFNFQFYFYLFLFSFYLILLFVLFFICLFIYLLYFNYFIMWVFFFNRKEKWIWEKSTFQLSRSSEQPDTEIYNGYFNYIPFLTWSVLRTRLKLILRVYDTLFNKAYVN